MPETSRRSSIDAGWRRQISSRVVSCRTTKAGTLWALEVSRRHWRRWARSSGSTSDAALFLSVLPAYVRGGVVALPCFALGSVGDAVAPADAASDLPVGDLPAETLPTEKLPAAALAATCSPAETGAACGLAAGGADFGVASQSGWEPQTSQASQVCHLGVSPKWRQIWRWRQLVDSTKSRIS